MDSETRTNLRCNWIDSLHEFAEPQLQQLWIIGDARIVATFTECLCRYFDDLNLGDGIDTAIREGWLSPDEAEAIAGFHRLAETYKPPPGGDGTVLQDPRWSEVVHAAQDAWRELREIITDPTECKRMEDLESRWGRITDGLS